MQHAWTWIMYFRGDCMDFLFQSYEEFLIALVKRYNGKVQTTNKLYHSGVGRCFVVGGWCSAEVRCNYEPRGNFYCGLSFFRCKNGSAASCSSWAYNRVVNCIYYTDWICSVFEGCGRADRPNAILNNKCACSTLDNLSVFCLFVPFSLVTGIT